jgi:hypothetical protein
VDSCPEFLVVANHGAAFDIHAPRTGRELAEEFVRLHPAILTGELGENVFPEPSTDIITIEQGEGDFTIAYQSYLLSQGPDRDCVRTVACAVSERHVYSINLDTAGTRNNADMPTHERILRAFQFLK